MTNYNWHKEASKKWDERAEYWSNNSENMWTRGSRKTIIPFIKQYVPKKNMFLDIGCGDGQGAKLLHEEGYTVIGADISLEMIEKAKEKWGNQDGLSFIQADLVSLPFENQTLDAVMAINSLEWIEIPQLALKEIHRILKPSGYLCAGILGPTAAPRANSYKRLYGEEVIMNTMMPWEFKKLAEELNWEIIASHGVFKREVKKEQLHNLSEELKQALSFMWVFILKKKQ